MADKSYRAQQCREEYNACVARNGLDGAFDRIRAEDTRKTTWYNEHIAREKALNMTCEHCNIKLVFAKHNPNHLSVRAKCCDNEYGIFPIISYADEFAEIVSWNIYRPHTEETNLDQIFFTKKEKCAACSEGVIYRVQRPYHHEDFCMNDNCGYWDGLMYG